jgi:two-component system phosphate regulon response regulator PhoB
VLPELVQSGHVALRVLCIDDDTRLYELLASYLGENGVHLEHASDGRQGLATLERGVFDAVLLDVMMPGLDGLEVCRRIREKSRIPVIMLTARGDETDRVVGLELGADDYVPKPFSPRELLARIQAVLRRAGPPGSADIIEVEGLRLDDSSHRVSAGDSEIALGPTEYRLLHFFMTHPERVFARGQLLDRVWGGNTYVEERTVDVHIRRLRKALEPYSLERFVQTVRGAGYRFSTRDA